VHAFPAGEPAAKRTKRDSREGRKRLRREQRASGRQTMLSINEIRDCRQNGDRPLSDVKELMGTELNSLGSIPYLRAGAGKERSGPFGGRGDRFRRSHTVSG